MSSSGHLFDKAIRPHLPDGLRVARRLTRSRPDAEDILQEASIRAFKAAHHVHDNPRAWFLAIVRNTALTWLAARRKLVLVPMDGLSPAELNEACRPIGVLEQTSAEGSLVQRADAVLLERAIQALPEDFRQAVILRDIQGLSYREVADVVRAPIGTVMSRLSRARGRLQRALTESLD